MNKIEFSKLILIVMYITAVVFTGVTAYLAYVNASITSFAPIILAIWAELATASGFYYWKAKSENKLKILRSLPAELIDRIKDIV